VAAHLYTTLAPLEGPEPVTLTALDFKSYEEVHQIGDLRYCACTRVRFGTTVLFYACSISKLNAEIHFECHVHRMQKMRQSFEEGVYGFHDPALDNIQAVFIQQVWWVGLGNAMQ
jgi:hypothetical protein